MAGARGRGRRPSGLAVLNRGCAAAQGLLAWFPTCTNATWIDKARGLAMSAGSGGFVLGAGHPSGGLGVANKVNEQGLSVTVPSYMKTSAMSLVAFVTPMGTPDAAAAFAAIQYSSSTTTSPYLTAGLIYRNSVYEFFFAITNGAGFSSIDSTLNPASRVGTMDVLVAVMTSGGQAFYVNGVQAGSLTNTGTNAFTASSFLTIGDISGNSRKTNAVMHDLRVYDRILTQAEVVDLSTRSLWDLYWVPSPTVYVDLGAAPPAGRLSRLSLMGVA